MKNTKSLEIIEQEVRRTFQKENLLSIILFGSAVNSQKRAHDFDILVIAKRLPKRDWLVAGGIKSKLLGKVEKPVDIVLLEEKDLAYGSPFLFEVVRKNKVLWGKNIISFMSKKIQGITPLVRGGKKIGWEIAQ